MLTIDRAAGSDGPLVVRLLQAQLDEHAITVSQERLAAVVAMLIGIPERGAILLAREGGNPVGLAALCFMLTPEHGGFVAWLEELYVIPNHRGKGVGAALLAQARQLCQESGCTAIDLEVEASHHRAENLYRRVGFRPLQRSRWSLLISRSGVVSQPGHRPNSVLDHIFLGVNDLERAKFFYDAALAPLGMVAHRTSEGEVAYGPDNAEVAVEGFSFYIGFEDPTCRRPVASSEGFLVAFRARTRAEVRAFHRASLVAGGRDNGAPGLRPTYHANYYSAFALDPDGHHVEATCHAPPSIVGE